MARLIVNTYHKGNQAGAHAPKSRVVQAMQQKYYLPNLRARVYKIVNECMSCQLGHPITRPKQARQYQQTTSYPDKQTKKQQQAIPADPQVPKEPG
jgi:adenylate cyclase